MPTNDPDMIPNIEGLLATASKYQFEDICRAIIEHIKEQWPNVLARWDLFAGYVGAGVETPFFLAIDFIPESATAVALARKYDIFEILPAAFYDLSTIASLSDWDYRFANEEHRSELALDYCGRAARWKLLSQSDTMAIFQGREILAIYARKFSQQSFFYEACKPVPNSECLKARELLRKKIYPEGAQDILRRLQTLMASASEPVCGRCRGTMEYYIDKERREIWCALPEIFNLPKGAHPAEFKGRLIIADCRLKDCWTDGG